MQWHRLLNVSVATRTAPLVLRWRRATRRRHLRRHWSPRCLWWRPKRRRWWARSWSVSQRKRLKVPAENKTSSRREICIGARRQWAAYLRDMWYNCLDCHLLSCQRPLNKSNYVSRLHLEQTHENLQRFEHQAGLTDTRYSPHKGLSAEDTRFHRVGDGTLPVSTNDRLEEARLECFYVEKSHLNKMAAVFNLFPFNVEKRVGHTVYIHLTRDKTKMERKNENCFFFCQILNVLWYILLKMEKRGEAAPCCL